MKANIQKSFGDLLLTVTLLLTVAVSLALISLVAGNSASGQQPPASRNPTAKGREPMGPHPFPQRRPAPSLEGGTGWINTSAPLDLKDLRGKFVVLDFWTYCCINCIHVLPELKKLEKAYPNEVVVIGVHSAKFAGEQDTQNIKDAVMRYEIEHPVINDAEHKIWNRYRVNSWPSFRIIDPEGNLVAMDSGETKFEVFDDFLKKNLPYYRDRNLLNLEPIKFDLERAKEAATPLRFPGKVLADEASNRLFISDSNHNRIVITDLAGKLLDIIGNGVIGAADGNYKTATFDHPQGMALRGDTLYVADTENHLIRKVDLKSKQVSTIAGLGFQGKSAWPGLWGEDGQLVAGIVPGNPPERFVGAPKATALNSPWDLYIHDKDLYIAMAGPHQIWKMSLDEKEIGPYAGNGRESIVDGRLLPKEPYQTGYSSFAQPSGLTSDGTLLFVADSEGSAIRAVPFDTRKPVKTIIGTLNSLFTFGDKDGNKSQALLQHALGVVYHDKLLYVADTYNNKIKVVDPAKNTSTTLVGSGKEGATDSPAEFDEPSGITYAAGKLYVADTNNHVIRTIDLANNNAVATLTIEGLAHPATALNPAVVRKPSFRDAQQVKLAPVTVQPGPEGVVLNVQLNLPTDWHMNELAPNLYMVEAEGEKGPVDRGSIGSVVRLTDPKASFEVPLKLTAQSGQETVKVSMNYYYCKGGPEGTCKQGSVVWTIPLTIAANGQKEAVAVPLKVSE
ncbi:MAG: thioredoxin-like domain-containing protein [Planctomycetota bacterium]|nr:thioredoxin-like domain-containing protein [Planctomycetota bacterium]